MPTGDVVLFDIGETLGAVFDDSSPRLLRLEVFSYVLPVLERLRQDGTLLGLISNTGSEPAANIDRMLERSRILRYFAPELRIYSSVVGLKKDSPAIFELAMGRAQRILGRPISKAAFVGESRAERAFAVKAGMRSAPHPILARSVLAGGRPTYLLLRVRRDEVQRLADLFDAAGVVPLRRIDVDANAEIIALATDTAIPQLQAGGVAVEVLPGPADAAGDDLYLLRGLPPGSAPATFSAFAESGLKPVLDTRDGVVVALAPHQSIDDFHVGEGHGHNLKLLADPTLLFRRAPASAFAAPAFAAEATLSSEELATLAATITEQRFEQVLRFVAGMDGRPGAVGINRHVLSPQMRAVTDGLLAELERIGQGAFNVSGHRFEITGRDLKDVFGTPVANRIELYNVIAELPGDSDETVLVTAHLDSTAAGTFGGSYNPAVHDAPGVDDDGSGVAAVLLIAEFMRVMFAGRKPARTLRFVLFNAEEQGLIGSERYARAHASTGAKITAVLQMDMIAYNNSQPNVFEVHAGTADPEVERASLAVADLIRRMAEKLGTEGLSILAPGQILGSPDPADGYSDHSSFQRRGYAGCATSEDFFPSPGNPADRNPNYHLVSDRIFDLPFATSLTRVICAAALRAAHPVAPHTFAAAGLTAAAGSAERVSGRIVADGDQPLPGGVTASVRGGGTQASTEVGQATIAQDGSFAVQVPPGSYHVVVQAANGAPLASTHETPFLVEAGTPLQLLITLKRLPSLMAAEPGNRRSALFADMTLNAAAASEITPDDVLDLARAMVAPDKSAFEGRFFAANGAAAPSVDDPKRTLCGTERLEKIFRLADLQGYVDPEIVKLKVRDILAMGESGFASKTHVTPNFAISYQTDGPAAVENDLSAFDVIEPGSKPLRVVATLPGGTVPAYVRLVAFWLERSLQFYTSAPFSMRNPAANGRLSAFINSDDFGAANPSGFYINNKLPPDLVCAVAVHELFHMVQYAYDGPGPWRAGVFEGGATFAEDTVADLMNRYLDEAGHNFNGIGLLADPNQSLFSPGARYKSSLFWRYLAEQRSRLVEEPTIGVDAYRRVIEECLANGYTTDSVKRAIRALPFDAELCTFGYDPGMAETPANTETTFGNFALACYLKDLAARPDARFGFLENAENIHIDDAVRLVIPSAPTAETLVQVKRERARVTKDGPKVVLQGSVNVLANRFFEIEVAPDVETVDLDFSAGAAFAGLVQLVAIEENGQVRDIVRTDKRAYRRRLANQLGTQRMSTLAVIVSGGDSGGSFQISVQSAEAVADVMITRWNSETGKEYHLNPQGSAWTWVSPDLWFEPAAGGAFAIKVRLRNKGGKRADNVGCVVEYRPGAAAGPAVPWLPILDASGAVQRIEGERIESGQVREFTLPWKPAQVSEDGIFTLRANVASADDANTDNNSAFSRLGMMRAPGGFATFMIPAAMSAFARAGNLEAVPRQRESSRLLLGVGSASGAGNAMLQRSLATGVRTVAHIRESDESAHRAMPAFCATCSALTLRLRRPNGSLAPGATVFFAEEDRRPAATFTAAGTPAGKTTGFGARWFMGDAALRRPEAGLFASEFWGISRHEAIAAAAERDLSDNTAEEVRRIMAPLGAEFPFSKLAGWADTVKRRRPRPTDDPATVEFLEDERNKDNDTWHYVNMPAQAEGYDRQRYPTFTRDDDVVQMIAHAVRVLTGDSDRFSELNALRLLIHLVGDVHQPIHVGCAYIDQSTEPAKLVYDPQEAASQNLGHDRGGGRLYLPIGKGVNLHSYWDSRIGSLDSAEDVHDLDFAAPELKARFVQKLADMTTALPPLPAHFAPSDPERWAEQWATDSLVAAREAYSTLRLTGPRGSNDFDVTWEGKAAYDARCKPIANQQLATAVRNLAALLNKIWS